MSLLVYRVFLDGEFKGCVSIPAMTSKKRREYIRKKYGKRARSFFWEDASR